MARERLAAGTPSGRMRDVPPASASTLLGTILPSHPTPSLALSFPPLPRPPPILGAWTRFRPPASPAHTPCPTPGPDPLHLRRARDPQQWRPRGLCIAGAPGDRGRRREAAQGARAGGRGRRPLEQQPRPPSLSPGGDRLISTPGQSRRGEHFQGVSFRLFL